MLKIINIIIDGTLLSCMILIECDPGKAYRLVLDTTKDFYPVVDSEIPEDEKMYERQARMALFQYHGKEFPETITSAWY